MAGEVVPMDVRMRIAVASPGLNVSEFCREQGISRETFYVWRRRWEAEGEAGLQPRSRAPLSNPGRVSAEVEDEIVAFRKELTELGVDAGPSTIQYHLGRRATANGAGRRAVPSVATVWRVLVRRGFVVPEPRKRPKTALRRFEASAPNELWQADTTEWTIATGVVKILSFLDDHSRVALRVKALAEATTNATWEAFCEAAAAWGVPLGQLTDNGVNFSGKLRGFEVRFEIELRAIGVVPKTSRPYHPQTCGKVERFQQTLKKWLRRRPLAKDLAELQAQINAFVAYYNHRRPHRGIGRTTPAERWAVTPPAINLGTALPGPANTTAATAGPAGIVKVGGYRIQLGKTWAKHPVRVHWDDHHFAVFTGHRLIRAGTIDHTRNYQGLTGRRNKRHLP